MAGPPRTLATGIYFGEGPRWHADETGGRLWFSDFHANTVYSLGMEGDLRTELELDDWPSGLGWMPDGSLLVVKMHARQVWRRWPDGRFALHADIADQTAHLANDMVVDSQGRAYVGDFGFDLDAALAERGPDGVLADHPVTNIVRIDPDGSVHVAASEMHFPNGPVITPDGKTLIVGETLAACLTAFDIGADGSLSNRRVWAPTLPHVPDGICLDAEGAVWIADPISPSCVRIAEGGEVLERVDTGDLFCFACMLGGDDGRDLFMMLAPTSVAEIVNKQPLGQIAVARVDVGRAGLP